MFKREQGARSVRAVARLAVAAAFVAGALITGTAGAQAAPAEQAAPVAAAACTQVGNVSGTVSAFTLYDSNNYTGACITFWKYGACTASTSDIEGAWNLMRLELGQPRELGAHVQQVRPDALRRA